MADLSQVKFQSLFEHVHRQITYLQYYCLDIHRAVAFQTGIVFTHLAYDEFRCSATKRGLGSFNQIFKGDLKRKFLLMQMDSTFE